MTHTTLRSVLLAAGLAALSLTGAADARAAAGAEEWARLRGAPGYRLDVDLQLDRLDPQDLYGNWATGTATLYVKTLPRLTPFAQVSVLEREDVDAGFSVGTYADWTGRLYSSTSFTAGGRSHYLQKNRWDHAFYLNTGPVALVAGAGWLQDHDGHEDWSLAFGPRLWRGRLILEYLATRTVSDPGDHVGWKHRVSGGWGEEGRSWLFANLTVGQERYAATWVSPVQDVDHDFYEIAVTWQRWVRPRLGYKLQAGWLDLGEGLDGYEKLGFGIGGFVEF